MQETTSTPAKKKSKLKTFVRVGLSLGLAAVIYLTVDQEALLRTLSRVSIKGAATLVIIYIMGQILSAMKWRIFVERIGMKPTPYEVLRAYFVGMFVNVYGFGTVGGDVARGLMLSPKRGQRAAALATVLADRIHGLTILLGLGSVCMLTIRPEALGNLVLMLGFGGLAGLLALLVAWWLGPRILVRLFPENHKWGHAAARVSEAFPRRPKTFATVSFISFLFHNVQILMHFVIAQQLGADISLAYIYATIPFVNIVSSLPISVFNGLGVREAMYCMMLIPLGVPKETAVAFGTIWLFTVTLVSSVGILLFTPATKEIIKQGKEAEGKPEAALAKENAKVRQTAVG